MLRRDFERLVAQALDALPAWVGERMDNLGIRVEERPSKALCKDMGIPYAEGLLGLYEGPSLLERDPAVMSGPSRVVLYQRMIESEARHEADLPRVVLETLAHEIGHYFGMTDDEIEAFEAEWERRRRTPHSP